MGHSSAAKPGKLFLLSAAGQATEAADSISSAQIRKHTQQKQYRKANMQSETVSLRRTICEIILQQGFANNPDLAYQLHLSLPTVTSHTKALQEAGMLKTDGKCPSSGGKRANKLILNPDFAYPCGIDITNRRAVAVITDFCGKQIEEVRLDMPFAYSEEYFAAVTDTVLAACRKHGLKAELPWCVLSLPAIVKNNTFVFSHALEAQSLNFARLGTMLGCSNLLLLNDSNAGAIAESVYHEPDSFFYLSLSETVGGALIDSGRLCEGINSRAGEIGHVTIIPNGRTCYCGKDGCVDPYLCSKALLGEEFATHTEFFAALHSGNTMAAERFEQYMDILSLVINNLSMVLDLPVVLGGRIGRHLEPYLIEISRRTAERCIFSSKPLLAGCRVKRNAAATGAARIALNEVLSSVS